MPKGVLAATSDGRITYCTCPPDQRGKGRCNHTFHQEEGESTQDFMDKVLNKEKLASYHMPILDQAELKEIRGRKDLADETNEGGYISLDTAVWSPSNIAEYSRDYKIKTTFINSLLKKSIYLDKETFKPLSQNQIDKIKEETPFTEEELATLSKAKMEAKRIEYLKNFASTGVTALNAMAERDGYEATKNVYVLPYYMRQNTGDIQNPLNVLYNYLIVSKAKNDPEKLQECYDKLLDNKHADKHGYKPLTSHGGYAIDSLADLVNGKSGIMRGYITGFSIPNAGRAVISPNIKMKYGDVGIPSKMAAKIFRPTLEKKLIIEERKNPEKVQKWLDKMEEGRDVTEKEVELLDNALQDCGCKCLLNRQPSLHTPSMVCFKPRVTEVVDPSSFRSASKETIHLNPMLAKGFNADHDGDTAAVYAINDQDISNDAWDEMSPFTKLIANNPKYQSESMTVPTKDCLFGLLSILEN